MSVRCAGEALENSGKMFRKRTKEKVMISKILIYTIASWTGFVIMSVELLSGKLLAPYFGSSIYVWGAIITVFMLALSLGYLLGGNWSLHHATLQRLAGILCIASIMILPIAIFGEALMDSLFNVVQDPRYGSLAASSLLFFIPTTIAGMISPYSVRLLTHKHENSGSNAGKLYFPPTLGSALGTILTSFYLVLFFDLNNILYGLVAISLILSLPLLFKVIRYETH